MNTDEIRETLMDINLLRGHRDLLSLVLPPRDKVARFLKMLESDRATLTNGRWPGALACIVLAESILARFDKTPKNGLVIYCGKVGDRVIDVAFEPPVPITYSLYLMDDKFHSEGVEEELFPRY